jgi:outer membrane immunogenic protein
MKKHLIGAFALLAFTAAPAMAADMAVKAPAPVVLPSWTGFYIGVNAGGGYSSIDTSAGDVRSTDGFFALANVVAVQNGGSQSFNGSGALAGGQIGYLYETGKFIFGVEVSADWTNIRGSINVNPTVYPVTPPSTFAWNLRGSADSMVLFTGRVGYDFGSWFPYVTGGGAYARLKYNVNFVDTFYPTNNTFAFRDDNFGWVLGVGAEYKLTENWLLRGEYLHVEFGDFGGRGLISCNAPGVPNCAAGGNTVLFTYNARIREDIGRVALSYRFGGPVVARY